MSAGDRREPEQYRLTAELCRKRGISISIASDSSHEMNGMFIVPCLNQFLRCMISDGAGMEPDEQKWEHVSVSLMYRCPTWEEMCFAKDLFWDAGEMVMQLHPPKSEYVNNHPFCLHLWKPVGIELPAPDSILVGAKRNKITMNHKNKPAGIPRRLVRARQVHKPHPHPPRGG